MITRIIRGLPASQVEVCIIVFAVLSFETYVANWSEPKNIDIPLIVNIENPPPAIGSTTTG